LFFKSNKPIPFSGFAAMWLSGGVLKPLQNLQIFQKNNCKRIFEKRITKTTQIWRIWKTSDLTINILNVFISSFPVQTYEFIIRFENGGFIGISMILWKYIVYIILRVFRNMIIFRFLFLFYFYLDSTISKSNFDESWPIIPKLILLKNKNLGLCTRINYSGFGFRVLETFGCFDTTI